MFLHFSTYTYNMLNEFQATACMFSIIYSKTKSRSLLDISFSKKRLGKVVWFFGPHQLVTCDKRRMSPLS